MSDKYTLMKTPKFNDTPDPIILHPQPSANFGKQAANHGFSGLLDLWAKPCPGFEVRPFDAIDHQPPGKIPQPARYLDGFDHSKSMAGKAEEIHREGSSMRLEAMERARLCAGLDGVDQEDGFSALPGCHQSGAFTRLLADLDPGQAKRRYPARDQHADGVIAAEFVADSDDQDARLINHRVNSNPYQNRPGGRAIDSLQIERQAVERVAPLGDLRKIHPLQNHDASFQQDLVRGT